MQRLVAGFASTITPRFYQDYTLPAYTFDKINVGLIDAHAFAGNSQSLATLNLATDAALPSLPEKALTRPEMAARPHPNVAHTWDESYTLPENLYLAWKRGAGERYRGLARRFLLDRDYFEPLARGENVLPGKHAYSHMNALSSAMQAYSRGRQPQAFRAAKNGFDFVLAQSFATGGWGPNERFIVPGSGELGDSLHTTHAQFRNPLRCLRPLQSGALSHGCDRRQPLWGQHGAGSIQRNFGRAADETGRHRLLLLGLQRYRRQGLFRLEMPMLLGNVGPDPRRLWNERVFGRRT